MFVWVFRKQFLVFPFTLCAQGCWPGNRVRDLQGEYRLLAPARPLRAPITIYRAANIYRAGETHVKLDRVSQ
jgi:hypothetical protein